MNLTVVVAIAALPTVALVAWALWLLFNVLIARRHGQDRWARGTEPRQEASSEM